MTRDAVSYKMKGEPYLYWPIEENETKVNPLEFAIQGIKGEISAKEMEQVARQRHNELEAAVSKKEAELKLIQDKKSGG